MVFKPGKLGEDSFYEKREGKYMFVDKANFCIGCLINHEILV